MGKMHLVKPPPYLTTAKFSGRSANWYRLGSSNWSGFETKAASGNRYRSALGRWYEPHFYHSACRSNAEVTWVGLGGSARPRNVLGQDGTAWHLQGVKLHQSWTELLPKQKTAIPQRIKATPGGLFEAYVKRYSGGFHFLLYNIYTGEGTTIDAPYSRYNGRTAEAIVERPTYVYSNGSTSLANLSNFRKLRFKGAWVNGSSASNRIGRYPHHKITMSSSRHVLSKPNNLYNGGKSFSVVQYHCR